MEIYRLKTQSEAEKDAKNALKKHQRFIQFIRIFNYNGIMKKQQCIDALYVCIIAV